MAEITLTQENFEAEVLKSDKPVIVDFWASWCGPCKKLGPIISQIADEKEGTVKVGKLNVDEQMAVASKYNIMSIPTVILFKDGQPVNTSVGYKSKEELLSFFGI
ncbi:MAG: thioredoxin [Lachnospiraceae bacterium]|nr:thioredoxin [Lachnospiraceae bacterium]